MGAHFEALIEGVLMTPLDSRYTQVGFNLISVQVCLGNFSSNRKYLRVAFSTFPHPPNSVESKRETAFARGITKKLVQLHLEAFDSEIEMWPGGGEAIYRDGEYVG